MKRYLLVVVFLLIVETFATAQKSEPFSFPFNQIPYGSDIETVKALLDGTRIVESKYSEVEFIGNYRITILNEGGLFSFYGIGTYMTEVLSKKLTITCDDWVNIKKIDLYFVKDFDKDNYSLAIVVKTFIGKGDYRNIYFGYINSISKTLSGKKPIENVVKYQDSYMRNSGTYTTGLVAKWDLDDQIIYVLENDQIYVAGDPQIVYILKAGLEKYLRACREYKDAKNKEEESANTPSF